MAATTSTSLDFKDMVSALHFKITSATTVYSGRHAAVDISTGLLQNMADTANYVPAGVVVSGENGEATLLGTALATEGDVGANVRGDIIVKDMAVTGVAAVTDIGKLVYATDNETYTLTRPADDAVPIGIIVYKKRASTDAVADVYVFDFVTAALVSLTRTKTCQPLGFLEAGGLIDATDDIALLDLQLFGHGKITKIYAVSQGYDTDWATGSVITNAKIGGTTIKTAAAAAVTLTLTEASIDAAADRGTTIDLATAIGAANEFHDGDNFTLNIVNAGSTAFTRTGGTADNGGWNIYAEIEWLPGA